MKRLGIGTVVAVSLIAAGCGGGGSDAPAKTPTPAKVSLADSCPKVQDALDAAFKGGGELPTEEEYLGFGDDLTELIAAVDPKGKPLLSGLLDATKKLATGMDDGLQGQPFLDLDQAWLGAMKRVNDTCQQLGAPLS